MWTRVIATGIVCRNVVPDGVGPVKAISTPVPRCTVTSVIYSMFIATVLSWITDPTLRDSLQTLLITIGSFGA